MRVCVIGGGVSGLTSVKACLEEGLQPVCYEATDGIGGIWRHTGRLVPRVFSQLKMNTSRDMSCFSDFPTSRHTNPFLSHHEYQRYLQEYARHFNLLHHVHYSSPVTRVRRVGDAWIVHVTKKDDETSEETFDAVMVCSGRFRKPVFADLDGLNDFQGLVEHSIDFRSNDSVKYGGKDVLVVGNSFTAGDMAGLISETANKVYLALGFGTTVVSRYCATQDFVPFDQAVLRRVHLYSAGMADFFVRTFSEESSCQLDHSQYDMVPDRNIIFSPFMINDILASRIKDGAVEPKRHISRLTDSTVVFRDGEEKRIDVVAMATGYEIDYPFLEKGLLPKKAADLELYEMVWPLQPKAANMAFIGCYSPKQCVTPGVELQARWAVRVFSGKLELPDPETMRAEIRERNQALAATTGKINTCPPATTVHYQDRLAGYLSAMPDADKLAKKDAALARAVQDGPAFPFHYRLEGPHASPDARDWSLQAYNTWKRQTSAASA